MHKEILAMEEIMVRPQNKKEKTLIKIFFKGLNMEIEERDETTSDITNPVILERLERIRKDQEGNTIRIDPKNVWKSISSK